MSQLETLRPVPEFLDTKTKNQGFRLKNQKKLNLEEIKLNENEMYCFRCNRIYDKEFFQMKRSVDKTKLSKMCSRCREGINKCSKNYYNTHDIVKNKCKHHCEICKLDVLDIVKHKKSKFHLHILKTFHGNN